MINKPCSLTTFRIAPPSFPGIAPVPLGEVCSTSRAVAQSSLSYSQICKAALHPSSFQLLGGHQHNVVRHRHRGGLPFTEDQEGKQIVWVSSADSRVQLYLVEFVSYKWHPKVLIKVK